jgi:hypothetical protein
MASQSGGGAGDVCDEDEDGDGDWPVAVAEVVADSSPSVRPIDPNMLDLSWSHSHSHSHSYSYSYSYSQPLIAWCGELSIVRIDG